MACLEVSRNQIFQGLLSCLGSRKRFNIRILKAITARRPWRKIPNESIRAPFWQPRGFAPVFALGATEMLLRDRACWAPTASGPVSMLAPLAAVMRHKCPAKKRRDSRQMLTADVGQLIDRLHRRVSGECWWHPFSELALILLFCLKMSFQFHSPHLRYGVILDILQEKNLPVTINVTTLNTYHFKLVSTCKQHIRRSYFVQ